MGRALTIGQAAKATGVAAKTIRYYEQIGVLPAPRRTASGYRQYDESGVERLRFIRRARALGLPLQDLKALTTTLNGGPRPALRPRLRTLVHEQLAAVRRQITDLELVQRQLAEAANRLRTAPRGRPTGACRCLETKNAARRPPRRPALRA
jgi:MerR family mercuric resistance operon transcriptional regulator